MQGKPFTSSKGLREEGKMNFGDAFGLTTSAPMPMKQMAPETEVSAEQTVLLEPYPFASSTKNADV